ncbi:hypothetical protein ACI8B_270021 [Acinetobacter proteolyticus]|uniref:Uncharacterized protein n=1 Tax=Acinetobacter proteolyticus TaxID=1776741 RepID=A0A653K5E0_9GAMM|nr:hypothetical protein ACI8B_270021 [Acinetobacter proteolyticus]
MSGLYKNNFIDFVLILIKAISLTHYLSEAISEYGLACICIDKRKR